MALEAEGPPIATVACFCTSCQEAGRRFVPPGAAAPMLDPDGGTSVVLVRKDRVRCLSGEDLLEERRLAPASPTRRVFATCCDCAMFVDLASGHWLSLYRNRIPAGAPPLQMRLMTSRRRAGVELAGDVANFPGVSARFIAKLALAWIGMGLRRPRIAWGRPAGAARAA
ncbi:hypothetical protein GXW79_12115 [Roseomonas arctica]|uniref:CENP-V/GFA domain-containing protein n=1 Tax=Plastoroseomonas arctica TaxID=1509237 RepID=A0AAF1JX44_9PROT|nr:hypothetical protein [Plastoroseomonas arctica]